MRHQIAQTSQITCLQGEPVPLFREWYAAGGDGERLLLVEFELNPWWLDNAPPVSLTAIYCLQDSGLSCAVTDRVLETGTPLSPCKQYARWIEEYELFSVIPGDPLPLMPTSIPKPWGREIWFTGVEERGVCCFGNNAGRVPIPWLQAILPDSEAGVGGEPLVLLKVLDPAPEEVTGDLYFELHEEKREVYVVTHVDRGAWPGGRGYIRYGFSPQAIAEAGSEDQFRAAYLCAVRAYEAIRRDIDEGGEALTADVVQRERELRRNMESYTHLQALEIGDVVVVPLLMPHSLQHGVRTIEFQTPVYERKILSFAQEVLTQGHWDTEAAVRQMRLQPPEPRSFECLLDEGGVTSERIVDFPDFEVRRIRVQPGSGFELLLQHSYGLVMLVEGGLSLESGEFGPEEAFLVPRGRQVSLAPPQGAQPLVFLLALPRS